MDSDVNALDKVAHKIPMGSLDKAMNKAEFDKWVAKTAKALGIPVEKLVLTASLKADGGSYNATYAGTKFKQGITRGDGFIGEDVTHTVRNFQGIPKTSLIGDGFVRFEGVLTNDDWLEADPDQLSNPRNVANGIGRRKDGSQSELITAIAFRAHNAQGHPLGASEYENLSLLKLHGFTPVPHTTGSAEDVWKFHDVILSDRANIAYWIDGIVVKVDSFAQQSELEDNGPLPKWAVAIKFPEDSVETVIRSIDITVGHTGAIIPTAQFDPVRIGGTDVESALLCNWNVIEALDVAVGDTVRVYKAGAIIPKILRVTHRPENRVIAPRPTKCPVCGGPVDHKTTVKGKQSAMLYCLSDDCPAKVAGKIRRFVKSLDILGLGDEIIAAITRKEFGVKSAADLYRLIARQDDLAALVL